MRRGCRIVRLCNYMPLAMCVLDDDGVVAPVPDRRHVRLAINWHATPTLRDQLIPHHCNRIPAWQITRVVSIILYDKAARRDGMHVHGYLVRNVLSLDPDEAPWRRRQLARPPHSSALFLDLLAAIHCAQEKQSACITTHYRGVKKHNARIRSRYCDTGASTSSLEK